MIPHFTTVTIQNISQPGAVAVGQTVEAALNIEGGGTYSPEQYPGLEMKYQWYKYEPMAAYPTSHPIAGATEATYTISEDDFGAEDQKYKIGVEITCGGQGDSQLPGSPGNRPYCRPRQAVPGGLSGK